MNLHRLKRPARKFLHLFLTFCILIPQFTVLFVADAYAADSPWTQTDWSGGSSQTSWSDNTKFDSSSNIDSSVAGQLTLSDWSSRRKITFDNSAQAENLTDFPVLVKLDSTRIDYSQTQDAGQDIRFTDSDGTTLLSYEIEKWDESGTSIVWVKVPQVDASSNTDFIYLYYGNPAASDSQNVTAVWSNSFIGVWHLTETGNGTAAEYNDSSPTGADGQGGSGTSTSTPTVDISGAIGNSATFDGGDWIDAGSSSVFKVTTTPFTFSAWVNPTDFAAIRIVMGNDNVSDGWNVRVVNTTGQFSMVTRGATNPFNSNGTLTAGIWSYISGTYSGDPDKLKQLYKNGVFDTSQNYSGSIASAACNFSLGSRLQGAGCINGVSAWLGGIDEIRMSSTVRSPSWITASYKSEADTFNTFGSAESINQMLSSAATGSLTSSIFDAGSSTNWGTLTYNATTPANTSVSVKVRSSSDSSMSSATDFTTCTAVTSSTDISSNNCVTDTHRYLQYQVTLSNTDGSSTPTFEDISITFTPTDATGPNLELDSPGDKSYTNNLRPSFRWKKATDASSSIADYDLFIDNASIGPNFPTGDFSITDIPVERTSDYETSKYVVQYENFSDSDSTNDYISVYTKSSPDWSTTENDGALREGVVTWKVRATDSMGNSSEVTRTLFVDITNPAVEINQINTSSFSGTNFYTTDQTPTLYGKITDVLSVGDPNQTQSQSGPRVASGPKTVTIQIEEKQSSQYILHTLYTINIDKFYFTCDNKEVVDKDQQNCDKYFSFQYTPSNLSPGTYRVSFIGTDIANNAYSRVLNLYINSTTSSQPFPLSPTIIPPAPTTSPTPTTHKVIETPQEITEASIDIFDFLAKLTTQLLEVFKSTTNYIASSLNDAIAFLQASSNYIAIYLNQTIAFLQASSNYIAIYLNQTIATLLTSTNNLFATLQQATNSLGLALVQYLISPLDQLIASAITQTNNLVASILNQSLQTLAFINQSISNGYNQLTNQSTGAAKTALINIGNSCIAIQSGLSKLYATSIATLAYLFENVSKTIASAVDNTISTANYIASNLNDAVTYGSKQTISFLSNIAKESTQKVSYIASSLSSMLSYSTKQTISFLSNVTQSSLQSVSYTASETAFRVGEKTQDISDTAGLAIIKFTYNFVSEPTTISNVRAVAISPTSAKISWTTNHPANGKVNWGTEPGIYEFEDQTDKRTTYHEFILTNLDPNTEYDYEVMSHNKNYVYDANRKFKTPTQE